MAGGGWEFSSRCSAPNRMLLRENCNSSEGFHRLRPGYFQYIRFHLEFYDKDKSSKLPRI